MHRKSNIFLIFILSCLSCTDPFDFLIENQALNIVVDGYISNVSYNNSIAYPSDGRYFTVSLRTTSKVDNVKDTVIRNAKVILVNDAGSEWFYEEHDPGRYVLNEPEFKAKKHLRYKLKVILENGNEYESSWEQMPVARIPEMGDINFEEIERLVYDFQLRERVIIEKKGINVNLQLPINESQDQINYKWNFSPLWIYEAPFALRTSPVKVCWASNKYFLSKNELHQDYVGGYPIKLFFMDTELNEKIYYTFSVLVTQQALSNEYYNYWKEVIDQINRGGLFEAPPYNLKTNLKPVNHNANVDGYFAVVQEQAQRWYFDLSELSYEVRNGHANACSGGIIPRCSNCLEYTGGSATNIRPDWWPEGR